jgi:hypothetical protein
MPHAEVAGMSGRPRAGVWSERFSGDPLAGGGRTARRGGGGRPAPSVHLAAASPPAPGGAAGASAGGLTGAVAVCAALALVLLLASQWARRKLTPRSVSPRSAPVLLLPERPG